MQKVSTHVRVALQPLCTHARALRAAAQCLAGRPPPHSPPTPPPPPQRMPRGERPSPGAASGACRCALAPARVGRPDPFNRCHAVDDRGALARRPRGTAFSPGARPASHATGHRTLPGDAPRPPRPRPSNSAAETPRRRSIGSRGARRRAVGGGPSRTRLGTRGRRSRAAGLGRRSSPSAGRHAGPARGGRPRPLPARLHRRLGGGAPPKKRSAGQPIPARADQCGRGVPRAAPSRDHRSPGVGRFLVLPCPRGAPASREVAPTKLPNGPLD